MAARVRYNAFRRMWRAVPRPVQRRLKPILVTGIAGFLKRAGYGFVDHDGFLKHLQSNGLVPNTMIDVGAFIGGWSRGARPIFPNARYLMIEGNEDNRERLAMSVSEIGNAEFVIALLGPEEKDEVTFHVHSKGSSVLPELTSFGMEPRTVPMKRLDDLVATRTLEEPILLKLDAQGFELEILRGAPNTLARAEVVVLEASLIPYNEGAPLIAEVIAFMGSAGFVAYDIFGGHRRESDNALYQTDVAFTRPGSTLRAKKKFWLNES
jgi:FkbM family methyltransferase